MSNYIEYTLEDGSIVTIESGEEKSGGIRKAPRSMYGDIIRKTKIDYDDAFLAMEGAILKLSKSLKRMDADEAELTFGVKTAGEAGIFVITKGVNDANFTIKLKWGKQS